MHQEEMIIILQTIGVSDVFTAEWISISLKVLSFAIPLVENHEAPDRAKTSRKSLILKRLQLVVWASISDVV